MATIRTYHAYLIDSGIFNGATWVLPSGHYPPKIDGLGAYEGEVIDHLSQRLDLTTGVVVDYQPPAPPDTDLVTYAWDATTRRWVGTQTLAALVAGAHRAIDSAAGAARLRYITDVAGQSAVYLRKAEEARAWVATGFTGDAPPYIAAEAAATGTTSRALAEQVLTIAALWDAQLSPAIEAARIGGKRAASAATSAADVDAATQSAIATLGAI